MKTSDYFPRDTSGRLTLYKIDHESGKVNAIQDVNIVIHFAEPCIITDQLNKQRILCFNWNQFVFGDLINDEIVLSSPKQYAFREIYHAKLSGNQFCGFRNPYRRTDKNHLYQFCNIDLVTLTEQISEVTFPFKVSYACSNVNFLLIFIYYNSF